MNIKKVTLASLLIATGTSTLGYANNSVDSQLLHHWSFDEGRGNVISDKVGQLNGKISGKNFNWSTGVTNGGLQLQTDSCIDLTASHKNNSDSHIRLGRSDGKYKGWTLAVWVNKQTKQSSSTLLSSAQYHIDLENNKQSNPGLGRYGTDNLSFNYTAPIQQWIHLSWVATATSTTLYVNGKRQQTLWDNQFDVDNSAKSAITYDDFHRVYEGYNSLPLDVMGCTLDSQGMDTIIDDMKIYGAALAPQQVAQLYNTSINNSNLTNYQPVQYTKDDTVDRSTNIIPNPLSTQRLEGEFIIHAKTPLYAAKNKYQEKAVATQFSQATTKASGFWLALEEKNPASAPGITFALVPERGDLGEEGYALTVDAKKGINIIAATEKGLFYASQTLLQLLPAAVGSQSRITDVTWSIPAVRIIDKPRFEYRGYLLDVVRHFYTVEEVKDLVDTLAHYKINYLHLHLTDDQGWRIEIKKHPELTKVGGQFAHHGACDQCYYSQEQYQDIIAYAAQKHITVVPEIDVPGHTTVFMKAKNLCGQADTKIYGWVNNTLCFYTYPQWLSYLPTSIKEFVETQLTESGYLNSEQAYQHILAILDDIFAEVAAITPGEYIHLGADESSSSYYPRFVHDVQNIIKKFGKKSIGWNEMSEKVGVDNMEPDTIIQYWVKGSLKDHKNKVLLSPFDKIYLDQKYNDNIDYGYNRIDIKTAYDWEPASYLDGVDENRILGVEGTMWTESAAESGVVEFMSFPRQLGVAELGWSTPENRQWKDYRRRLQYHGERMDFQGINYYRSPAIWPQGNAIDANKQ